MCLVEPPLGVSAKPFIVPLFIPHSGCPHQCCFCNQHAVTGQKSGALDTPAMIRQIDTFLSYNREVRPVQISFFGGNFLGLPENKQIGLLKTAARYVDAGKAGSIRFSTRPDTITPKKLEILAPYPVRTVEIGVQSMNNRVLNRSGRGHTAKDSEQALVLLKQKGYETGMQMMIGLPGDDENSALETGRKIADSAPDFVRIYPTLVLTGSPLARMYQKGIYTPLSLDQAVNLTRRLRDCFIQNGIRVIRMGLQASEELDAGSAVLAGPYHPAFGDLVLSAAWLDRICSLISDPISGPISDKGTARLSGKKKNGKFLKIQVNPRMISRARGHHNKNTTYLQETFGFDTIQVVADASMPFDDIRLMMSRKPLPVKPHQM